MARELGISKTFRNLLRSRFHAQVRGDFRNILDTILPVHIVGQDYSDQERCTFGIASQRTFHVNKYSTLSLTSVVDVAIEALYLSAWDYGETFPYVLQGPLLFLTPDDSWVPWAHAFPPSYWAAGFRSRHEFDPGQTQVISGWQNNPPPYWGMHFNLNTRSGATLGLIPGSWKQCEQTVVEFNPPIILDAGLYATVCTPVINADLECTWRYREIG